MNGPEDAPPRRRPLALLSGLAAILLWQAVFLLHAQPQSTLGTSYALQASDGVPRRHADFVYFLYYLGLYPVASISSSPRDYSEEGARALIAAGRGAEAEAWLRRVTGSSVERLC